MRMVYQALPGTSRSGDYDRKTEKVIWNEHSIISFSHLSDLTFKIRAMSSVTPVVKQVELCFRCLYVLFVCRKK